MNLQNLRAEDIARMVLRVAFIVLGVYLVVRSILVLFDLVYQGVAEAASSGGSGDWVRTLIYFVSLLVTGGLLVIFSRRLASRLWPVERRAEAVTVKEPDPPTVCPSCGLAYNPLDYDHEALTWTCERCGAPLGP